MLLNLSLLLAAGYPAALPIPVKMDFFGACFIEGQPEYVNLDRYVSFTNTANCRLRLSPTRMRTPSSDQDITLVDAEKHPSPMVITVKVNNHEITVDCMAHRVTPHQKDSISIINQLIRNQSIPAICYSAGD